MVHFSVFYFLCCATILHATDLYPPEETVVEDGDEADAEVSDAKKNETDTPDDGSEEPEVDEADTSEDNAADDGSKQEDKNLTESENSKTSEPEEKITNEVPNITKMFG